MMLTLREKLSKYLGDIQSEMSEVRELLDEVDRLTEMNEAKGRLIKKIVEANETDADWMRKGLALCLKTKNV